MNRRNFLKSTGIISLLGFPNLSFAKNKKELKWISFKDEKPKIGQNIISLSVLRWQGLDGEWLDIPRCNMVIGRVEVDNYDWTEFNKRNNKNVKNEEFALKYQATIGINGFYEWRTVLTKQNGCQHRKYIVGDRFSYNTAVKLYQEEEFSKLEWINEGYKVAWDIGEWKSPVSKMNDKNYYWMPIGDKLPEQLPEFPIYKEFPR